MSGVDRGLGKCLNVLQKSRETNLEKKKAAGINLLLFLILKSVGIDFILQSLINL